MHELSIALSIIDLALQETKGIPSPGAIEELEIEIGRYAGVDKEALLFSLEAALPTYDIFNARITVIETEPLAECRLCGITFIPEGRFSQCPVCGSEEIDLKSGWELKLKSITVKE